MRYLLNELGDETFGFAVRVDICSIDRMDTEIPCGLHDRERWFFVQDPRLNERGRRPRETMISQPGEEWHTHEPFW